ncbi:DUF4263 domain-containing protein [Paenibacillus kribbensis]|uniref:Shedu immune nuclease family protein n=1 Tax=Paenibacillus kribbensis TaxID=172713 RepID=UPI002DBB617D|nr:Shedu immune nuclease family protein [Paenibacillus kribbensis]MEC0234878.1 DUF4263 domain-containing protein [Paenibacillus kribbensis]
MLNYKIEGEKTFMNINHKTIVGYWDNSLKGVLFQSDFIAPEYKYKDIINIRHMDIPNNFHFEIMGNHTEEPFDKLPYPAFCVTFSKEIDIFFVQFQISFDDDDEWRTQIKWIYEYYIAELKKQVSFMDNVQFVEIPSEYGPSCYVKCCENNSTTIGEALNEALSKLNELFLKTHYALQGIDKFMKVIDFWYKNKENSMESTWHEFFIQHNWVLSQCFSLPFILFKDKAYAGGKDLSNRGGSVLDFIYKNNLFENVAILEIKTPLTQLIGQEYRNSVFSISADLSGSLNQLLHYKDRLQKEYYVNKYNTKTAFHALNPKCVLLIGTLEGLGESEKQNFELFRSELRTIEIITYDELFEKIKLLKDLLQ